jgi:hypothetical protein
MDLHCMDCMKRELTMKGAKSVAPGEWAKILGEASSSSSSSEPKKPKKPKKPKESKKPVCDHPKCEIDRCDYPPPRIVSRSDSDSSVGNVSPLGRSDSDTSHVSGTPQRSDSMGSLRLSLSPFDSPFDETPPALRAARDDAPINLHMPRNIAMSNVEEFSYTDLPRKPRKSLADVLDKFYRDHQ